jgi:hypothetical protein
MLWATAEEEEKDEDDDDDGRIREMLRCLGFTQQV